MEDILIEKYENARSEYNKFMKEKLLLQLDATFKVETDRILLHSFKSFFDNNDFERYVESSENVNRENKELLYDVELDEQIVTILTEGSNSFPSCLYGLFDEYVNRNPDSLIGNRENGYHRYYEFGQGAKERTRGTVTLEFGPSSNYGHV